MADSRFTNVYKMLKDYNFDSENAVNSDVLCAICNKILINANSAPCGCRYYLECITAYLDGEDKCCPGNTDDCKIDLLNINNNIQTDHPTNIKISKLIVKCPEGQCDQKVELRKMEDHISVCYWKPTDCPFFNAGCRNVQMSNDKMEQHILSENHEHTKLLMDCIDILRNEVGGMKEEMREMREEVKGKQIVIDELRAVINNLDTKIKSYEAANLEMRNNEENQMSEMNQLKRKGTDIDVKINGLEKNVLIIAAKQIKMNYYGEFVWPIDNFADKRQKAQNRIETVIYSEPFFSHKNGYKMRLSVDPDGYGDGKGTHLSVFMHLMRGPFDDILQWPFRYEVTISIINQQTRLNHISEALKCDEESPNGECWQKPFTDSNTGFGNTQFIRLDQLMSDISLYNNDRIFIKCTAQIS